MLKVLCIKGKSQGLSIYVLINLCFRQVNSSNTAQNTTLQMDLITVSVITIIDQIVSNERFSSVKMNTETPEFYSYLPA